LTIVSSVELNLLVYLHSINEKKEFPGIEFNVDPLVYQGIKEKIIDTWNLIIMEGKQFNMIGRCDEIINNILEDIDLAKKNEISHFFKTWWYKQPKHGFGDIMGKLVFQIGRDELIRVIGDQHRTVILVFDSIPDDCQQSDENNFTIIPLYKFCPIL